jgi:hypothetical protein
MTEKFVQKKKKKQRQLLFFIANFASGIVFEQHSALHKRATTRSVSGYSAALAAARHTRQHYCCL